MSNPTAGPSRAEFIAIEAARAQAAATTTLLAAMLRGRRPVWPGGDHEGPPLWVDESGERAEAPDSIELVQEAQIMVGLIADDVEGTLIGAFAEIRAQSVAWRPPTDPAPRRG